MERTHLSVAPPVIDDQAPTPAQVFALRLFAQACDGPRVLRDRLVAAGLDSVTIAKAVGCSPRVLARVSDGGGTPRGVLMRLAGLSVVVEQLRANGIAVAAVGAPRDAHTDEAIAHLADQSDIARRLIASLAASDVASPQLQLGIAS